MASCAKSSGQPAGNRYKGIEGLLRRIAFNLGNSPSQTEVKIISCIPIDVTDLQQKIICLEKQLEQQNKSSRSNAVLPLMVNRTQLRVGYRPGATSAAPGNDTNQQLGQTPSNSSDARENEPTTAIVRDLYLNNCQTGNCAAFGKQIPEKDRTKLVYYAQTATASPFTKYKKATTNPNHTKIEETMDKEYLTSIIERQYRAGTMYMDDEAQGSQMSAPICRDVPRCATTSDDMCSCCHGHFLDVDREHKRPCYGPNVNNIYYDSSIYDMKPVKDEPNTSKKNDLTKKRGPEIDVAFFPEYYRFNPAEDLSPSARSKSVKFPKKKDRLTKPVFLIDDASQTDGLVEFSHVYTRQNRRLENSTDKSMSRNAGCNARSEFNTDIYIGPSKLIQTLSLAKFPSTSASKLVSENAVSVSRAKNEADCPVVTAKALQTASLSKLDSTTLHKVTFKNAEVLALDTKETECQTDPAKYSEATSPPQPDKTESTLNQIKSILQTVLTEVKTNSRMKTIVEDKEFRDAVVQKESGSSPDCERLLASYTYSGPFPLNNPYVPSCSGAVPAYCSSVMRQTVAVPPRAIDVSPDYNRVQNFPVLVQRTVATRHTCCSDRPVQAKQTSTNTLHEAPPAKKRNTETENLIKEIYKSIALNVDFPVKPKSREVVAEAGEATSAKGGKNMKSESVGADTITLGREEIIYRGAVGPSRFATRMVASPSSHSSVNIRPQRRSDSFHQPPRHITSSAQRRQFNVVEARSQLKPDSPESFSESDSDTPAAVQPSAAPTKPPPNIVKKGFFGKVVSSVMKRMRRKEDQPSPNPENRMNAIAEDSDSEFETLVSPKADKRVKHVSYAPAHRTPWRNIIQSANNARPTTSKTRRLGMRSAKPRPERYRPDDRPIRQPPRPKYAPARSAMRQYSGSSQIRRMIHRPNAPPRPHTPPEYMRRVPHNQYEWRTTPTACVDAALSAHSNDYKFKWKNTGIKITNKTWMRKPVHHLGFACGPEKNKILMQRY